RDHRRPVRGRGDERHHPGLLLQAHRQAHLPHGADPPPFRAAGMERADGRDPLLAHRLRAGAGGAGDVAAEMITRPAFAGKRYAVLGLARSGLATVDALVASGAEVVAWDKNEEARAQFLPGTGRGTATRSGVVEGVPGGSQAPLHHAPHGPPPRPGEDLVRLADPLETDLTGYAGVVVSPGVPLNTHPIAGHAAKFGVPVIGDIELFAQARANLPPHK